MTPTILVVEDEPAILELHPRQPRVTPATTVDGAPDAERAQRG